MVANLIRIATEDDAEQVLSIYVPVVRDTPVSFEIEPPGIDEMRQRMAATLEHLPWLVSEHQGEILGYAYATPHRVRPAYQWSVEVGVYVVSQYHRTGCGRELYRALMPILRQQGFRNAYAGIALPNPASVGFHEAFSFQLVGVYRSVGFKLGAWHDVGWWHYQIQDPGAAPEPPVRFSAIRETVLQKKE